jgi:tRNA pseudouridine32 synthase/23S rRNA pseudouridine746 synthase
MTCTHFSEFSEDISRIIPPKKFTFPFYYSPHPLALIAAKELQNYLHSQTEFDHNFGLEISKEGLEIGKMFGVLVVQNSDGKLGYLSAFSGKLANENHHTKFVPPVFDILQENGFFRIEEEKLNQINATIEQLEANQEYLSQKEELKYLTKEYEKDISAFKIEIKQNKAKRAIIRKEAINQLSSKEYDILIQNLIKESLKESYFLKDRIKSWRDKIELSQKKFDVFESEINSLKEIRKIKSAACQKQIFDNYYFLNAKKNKKSLGDIFEETTLQKPPAGAGECAAPKLLQYAFLNNFKPIALAEFWWGKSPSSEIRVHKNFYPACKSKCEPILGYMLSETDVDENPLLVNPGLTKHIEIIFEDEEILVVNKPENFLSVPGKNITDSVYERIKIKYPKATGPLLLHRLDMSTSGILIIAKNKEAHKFIQKQFLKRSIKKRYVALLEGILKKPNGNINLPLRGDIEDRPKQLVCYEHGKPSITNYEVIDVKNNKTKVYFYPVTGRTHQLRVHAAHSLGLNMPIVGDDLYGTKADRLYLHAESITFQHPKTKELVTFQVDAEF